MSTPEGSRTGPGARRATVSFTTGIIATVAYLIANPLIGVRPADLVPCPSTGVFISDTLPLLLVPPIVLGVVAIATGRSALGRSSARARAGAGIALGLARGGAGRRLRRAALPLVLGCIGRTSARPWVREDRAVIVGLVRYPGCFRGADARIVHEIRV